MDPRKPRDFGEEGANVVCLADVRARRTFEACRTIQSIWVVRTRNGGFELSFVRPAGAKVFAPESLQELAVELLAVGPGDEERAVPARLDGISVVVASVPGAPHLDEVRIRARLVLADPADAACLWFEADEGDASNVARIAFGRGEERLAWANARFPAVAIAPPPPSRHCM